MKQDSLSQDFAFSCSQCGDICNVETFLVVITLLGKEWKMTKELARNILTEHIRLMGDEPSLNEDKEALSMASKSHTGNGYCMSFSKLRTFSRKIRG